MKWLKVLGVVAILGAGVGAYHYVSKWLNDRREDDARIVELEAALDSMAEKTRQDLQRFHDDEEKWKERRASDSLQIAALTVDVEVAREEGERKAADLRARLPVQFRAEFDSLIEAHNREVQAILTREREKDAIIARQDARHTETITQFEAINGELQQQLALALEKSDRWERKSKRAIWEKPIFTVPATIITTVVITKWTTSN